METVLYRNLVDLINNSELTPGNEYMITDYPQERVIVTAETPNSLFVECYTASGSKGLYKPFNEGFNWGSSVGYLYYYNDGSNDCWFDGIQYPKMIGCTDTHIMPYYNEDGQLSIPEIDIKDCSGCMIDADTLYMAKCNNISVGRGNGEIHNSQFVVIGDNNKNYLIADCNGVNVGNDNENIHIAGSNDISIGDGNKDVEITTNNVIVGNENRYLNVLSPNNEVRHKNFDVSISSSYNDVVATKYSAIGANYNTVSHSNSVNIERSVGNTVRRSSLVLLQDVNDNTIFTDKLNLKKADAFQAFELNNDRNITVASNMVERINRQSDQLGTVLRKDQNAFPQMTKGKNEYYISDGIWTVAPEKALVNIDVSLSKTVTRYMTATGQGQYEEGDLVALEATMIGTDHKFDGWMDIETGEKHPQNPYAFTAVSDKVFVPMISEIK